MASASTSDGSAAPVVYRVDEGNTIIAVNDAWALSAMENGAPELAEHAVGAALFDAIDGPELTLLWRDLLARVRHAGVTLHLPYRCDSPGVRRYFELTVWPESDGVIGFESATRSTVVRSPQALLDATRGSGGHLVSCSWCRRFRVSGWVEVEEAVARLGLLEETMPIVTHGLCPDCEIRIRAAAGARRYSAPT
jgi:hypothetical protein